MFGFSKQSNEIAEQSVLYFEDYSHKDINEALVGRKGESLFHLLDLDVPTPDFFVVTPAIYKDFLLGAFEKKLAKLLEKVKNPEIRELEKIILSSDFSDAVREDILKAYSRLSGFSNAWVSVRSSVVYPQDKSVSFSGIFHTELSVKGIDQVIDAIKYVYLSVFRERVVLYSREKNVDLADLQMAVVVQRMVQPEVSGIVYTQDPITNDKNLLSVEAVFGLGDVIADGSITPDQYVLSKKRLEVVEKHISPQEWMHIRKPADKKVGTKETHQRIQISKSWSHQQKLEDPYLKDVAKVALIVETKSRAPQVLEWAWESGNVWILQHKSLLKPTAPTLEVENLDEKAKNVYDVALEMVKEDKQNQLAEKSQEITDTVVDDVTKEDETKAKHEARLEEDSHAAMVESKKLEEEVKKLNVLSEKVDKAIEKKELKIQKKSDKKTAVQGEKISEITTPTVGKTEMQFILSGVGASTGSVIGQLMFVNKKTPRDTVISRDDILLIQEFSQDLEPMIMNSGGIIMDVGGLTSDVAILCREIGIPAVVGTGLASTLLKEGEFIRVDGNVGSLYRYIVTREAPPIEEQANKSENKKEEPAKPEAKKEVEKVEERSKEEVKNVEIKDSSTISKQTSKKAEFAGIVAAKTSPTETTPQKVLTATKVFISKPSLQEADELEKVLQALDGVFYIDLDEMMIADGRHPQAYVEDKAYKEYSKKLEVELDAYADLAAGNEIVISIGSASVDEYRQLTKGKAMENNDAYGAMVGSQRLLENRKLLSIQIALIKKLRNTYNNRNISLAVHSPANGSTMTQVKKEITSGGLKRTGTFNLYVVIESPTEVILADDIASAGIDGMIINTPSLAMQMQGLNKHMKNAKYDIGANSVWKVVEDVILKTKDGKLKHIVLAEDNTKVMKKSVELGIYGVSVNIDFADKAKKTIADAEAKMIMSIE